MKRITIKVNSRESQRWTSSMPAALILKYTPQMKMSGLFHSI